MKYSLFTFLFMITVSYCYARPLGSDTLKQEQTLLYEKLYLHIDRELYSPGDDIWMKSYLVSGINHRLIQGYKNIYVQLIDEDGSITDQKLLLAYNGVAKGRFPAF
jgi:hypothetical protein